MNETTQNPAVHYKVEKFCTSPMALLLKGFLTEEECDHLINMAKATIKPSTTVDPETGEYIQVAARTSSGTYFSLRQTEIISNIEERIADIVGLPVENGEGLQVLNYQIGQEYKPHFDFFDPNHKGSHVVMANGGQRVATCLMYLHTPEEGGETCFPEVDLKVPPLRGDAILFFNMYPNGEVDRMSLHSSLPVTKGEKWVSTKWVREREYK